MLNLKNFTLFIIILLALNIINVKTISSNKQHNIDSSKIDFIFIHKNISYYIS